MRHIREVSDLKPGDWVMTPNGIGFYQGRWRTNQEITHLIIRHTIASVDPDQTGIAFPPGRSTAVRLYPVDQITL